eukprot:1724367-Prymnesium_polylepis.5
MSPAQSATSRTRSPRSSRLSASMHSVCRAGRPIGRRSSGAASPCVARCATGWGSDGLAVAARTLPLGGAVNFLGRICKKVAVTGGAWTGLRLHHT